MRGGDKMNNYLDEMEQEIEKRVELIESGEYEFVPEIPKGDRIAAIVLGAICLISIVVAYNWWT